MVHTSFRIDLHITKVTNIDVHPSQISFVSFLHDTQSYFEGTWYISCYPRYHSYEIISREPTIFRRQEVHLHYLPNMAKNLKFISAYLNQEVMNGCIFLVHKISVTCSLVSEEDDPIFFFISQSQISINIYMQYVVPFHVVWCLTNLVVCIFKLFWNVNG